MVNLFTIRFILIFYLKNNVFQYDVIYICRINFNKQTNIKKIILTVAAVFAFGFANAQETKFGVKGGLNLANFSGDIEDGSNLTGVNIGGFAEIKLSDKFALQPEVLFSGQGSDSDEGSFNLTYINVPLMAKYYVADKFNLEAGPQIGFLTSAKIKMDGNSIDSKRLFNSTDFGINFGAGYDFTEKFSAGVRYNMGVSNIFSDEFKDALQEDVNVQNSVFSLSLAYKFQQYKK